MSGAAALPGSDRLTVALTNAAPATLVVATIPVIFQTLVRRGSAPQQR